MNHSANKQARSRRLIVAMGVLALVLMTGPWVLRQFNESRTTAGKLAVFEQQSNAPPLDTAMCLLRHQPGGLMLKIESENNFTQPARQLAVRMEQAGSAQTITAWLPRGAALSAGETAQLQQCAVNPGKAPTA